MVKLIALIGFIACIAGSTILVYRIKNGPSKPFQVVGGTAWMKGPAEISDSVAVGYISADADLWYDRELGRYGFIGTSMTVDIPADQKAAFEAWMAHRKKTTWQVRKGYGIVEAPIP